MNTRKITPYIIIAVLVFLLALAVGGYYSARKDIKELKKLNDVANQNVSVWKGKDGLNRTKIELIETQNLKTFLAFKTQDTLLKELQSEVRDMKKYLKKQGSVTIIETITEYDTIYLSKGGVYDSMFKGFITDSINSEWIDVKFGFKFDSLLDGKFKIDSTMFKLKTKDKLSLTLGLEPTGFLGLGKGKPFAQVKNLNPYSATTNLKTYQVSPIDPKRFGLGVFTGIVLGSGLEIKPTIGLGLTYSLIQFTL
jgi:hypothetical protein